LSLSLKLGGLVQSSWSKLKRSYEFTKNNRGGQYFTDAIFATV